ncbi:hypothetical protein L1887_50305 [Cichorium endivia]|nr:hypothetical protein L1887_50305 [Cichorium endivia]
MRQPTQPPNTRLCSPLHLALGHSFDAWSSLGLDIVSSYHTCRCYRHRPKFMVSHMSPLKKGSRVQREVQAVAWKGGADESGAARPHRDGRGGLRPCQGDPS